MPPTRRRIDPEQLRAAAAAQSAALAEAGLPAPSDADPEQGVISAVASALREHLTPDPAALRMAVRLLADRLAQQHPGRSVEVRIPPYAAVQCIAGPRHTRGTPPNVVETDPATFIGLACGFIEWDAAEAEGHVRASGERSNLRSYLPLDVPGPHAPGP